MKNIENTDKILVALVSYVWLPLVPNFMEFIMAERRYMAIFCTQLHPDRSRNVTPAVEIRVGLYVKYERLSQCRFSLNSRLRTLFKEVCTEFRENPTRCSRRYHNTDSQIGRWTDGGFP